MLFEAIDKLTYSAMLKMAVVLKNASFQKLKTFGSSNLSHNDSIKIENFFGAYYGKKRGIVIYVENILNYMFLTTGFFGFISNTDLH